MPVNIWFDTHNRLLNRYHDYICRSERRCWANNTVINDNDIISVSLVFDGLRVTILNKMTSMNSRWPTKCYVITQNFELNNSSHLNIWLVGCWMLVIRLPLDIVHVFIILSFNLTNITSLVKQTTDGACNSGSLQVAYQIALDSTSWCWLMWLFKGQWRGALIMFSLICAWIISWANNGDAGDLRRHRDHYDVTLMPTLEMYSQYQRCFVNLISSWYN